MGNEPVERFWYLMEYQQILEDGLPTKILVGDETGARWYMAQCELLDACLELMQVACQIDENFIPSDLDPVIDRIARLLSWETFVE